MKGEVLHDYFARREGGGRLALILGTHLGWTVTGAFVAPGMKIRSEWPGVPVKTLEVKPGSRIKQTLNVARSWRRYRSPGKTKVYSGTYAPMGVFNHSASRNVLYCHTPPRYIYDQRSFYMTSIPLWQRPAYLGVLAYLRRVYEEAVGRMDEIVVNSNNVRRRVAGYLGMDSRVVYPPCDIEKYYWREPEGYYLSMARLDPLKRVDLVVEAFKDMPDKKLVVVSDGLERVRLEQLAGQASNIVFKGEVGDGSLRDLIARCTATVYVPADEDFGMSPVESMAAGKPVVGVAEGGLLETMSDGETGILLDANPGKEQVANAVSWLTAKRARDMRPACEKRAVRFHTQKFIHEMLRVVDHDYYRP